MGFGGWGCATFSAGGAGVEGAAFSLTPTSIKFNRFLKLILLEHKPLLACFGFVTSQKRLVSREINLRKRLNLIDVGALSEGGSVRGAATWVQGFRFGGVVRVEVWGCRV